MTSAKKPKGLLPSDLAAAAFDARIEELDTLRHGLQFQRDRTTSTVRRAILLEIIKEIDERITELRNGDL